MIQCTTEESQENKCFSCSDEFKESSPCIALHVKKLIIIIKCFKVNRSSSFNQIEHINIVASGNVCVFFYVTTFLRITQKRNAFSLQLLRKAHAASGIFGHIDIKCLQLLERLISCVQ